MIYGTLRVSSISALESRWLNFATRAAVGWVSLKLNGISASPHTLTANIAPFPLACRVLRIFTGMYNRSSRSMEASWARPPVESAPSKLKCKRADYPEYGWNLVIGHTAHRYKVVSLTNLYVSSSMPKLKAYPMREAVKNLLHSWSWNLVLQLQWKPVDFQSLMGMAHLGLC